MNDEPVSKTRRKKEMHELQSLGEELVGLPPDRLEGLDLPERLFDAIAEARRISTFGGRRRQMQYIGRLMREIDPDPIRERIDAVRGTGRRETALLHAAERWRDRLIAEEPALTELAQACPGADLQALRTMIRNARRESEQGKPPRAARELFRALRELLAPPPDRAREPEPDR